MTDRAEYVMDKDMVVIMIKDLAGILASEAGLVNGKPCYTVKVSDLVVIDLLLKGYNTLLSERLAIMDIIGE